MFGIIIQFVNMRPTDDLVKEDWFDDRKPTFLFKINVAGLPRQRANSEIAHLVEKYKSSNCNIIWLPVDTDSDVICIHGGSVKTESKFMERMLENTLNLDDGIIKEAELSGKFDDVQLSELKSIIRRTKIKSLLGES